MLKKLTMIIGISFLLFAFDVFSESTANDKNSRDYLAEGKKLLERGVKESQFETISNAIDFLRKAHDAGRESRFELGRALFLEDLLWSRQSKKIAKENESYLLIHKKRTPVGVVLLHELGTSPGEMRGLAEFLFQKGITVYAPLLAGHGTGVDDLKKAGPTDWRKNYLLGYEVMRLLSDKVYIVGSGWGGVLALELAIKKSLSGVVTLNAPFNLRGFSKHFLFLTQLSGLSVQWNKAKNEGYYFHARLPVRTYNQAYNIAAYVKSRLSEVTEPLIIFQSKNDPLVKANSADIINKKIQSKDKKIFWFNNAPHLLLSKNKPSSWLTMNEIARFINQPDLK